MTLYGQGDKIVTLSTSYNGGNIIAFLRFAYSTASPTHAAFFQSIFMHPLQAEPVLVSDDWMDQDQYSSVYNLHPEAQSYSYDVALGAG